MEEEIKEKKKLIYSMIYPLIMLGIMWIAKGLELYYDLDFGKYGILPRELLGLRGVLFAPFIHGSMEHLINNSVPLLFLGTALFYFYRSLAMRIFLLSFFLTSIYTWISARYSYHIGASGLVYALFSFLLVSGFIRKHIRLVAISFLVAFLYGSLVWGLLPYDQKVSFEGHFWGFAVGAILSIYYRKQGPQRKVYQWHDEDESSYAEALEDKDVPLREKDYWRPNSSDEDLKYEYKWRQSKKKE